MNHKTWFFSLLYLLVTVIACSKAEAKNLTGHIGLGFNQPMDITPPAIDVKYAFTRTLAISGGFALDTKDNENSVSLGGKFYRNIFSEDNANFYLGMSLYFVNKQTSGNSQNGVLLGGFLGVEYFLQGLPRLGFVLETGVVLETIGSVRFRTDAGSFVSAGMHYYF